MKTQTRFSRTDLAGSEKGPSVILLAFSIIALLVGSVAVAEDLRGTLSPDLSNGTCSPSATTLCLNDNRFSVAVSWQVPSQGRSGQGMSVPLSSDTGLFWFFDDSDIELVVKVLDGTGVNGDFWVFYAGLSNIEYTITVIDSKTGRVKSYQNPNGTFASFADTSAFSDSLSATAGDSAAEPTEAMAKAVETRSNLELYALFEGLSKTARVSPRTAAPCVAGSATLCLAGSRFQLTVDWHWQASSQGQSGHGTGVPISTSTGYFWFSNDANVELTVKILDARAIDGHFWVFAAALSNVEYTLTVTDTQTGLTKAWDNPQGQLASWADTRDFSDSTPIPQGLSGTWTGTLTMASTGRQSYRCEGSITVDLVESDRTLTGQFDTACGSFSLSGLIQGTALSGLLDGPDGQGQISAGLVSPNLIQFQTFQSSYGGGPGDHEVIKVSLSR